MKRYLIIYLDSDGTFCAEVVTADTLPIALGVFLDSAFAYEELYSITRAS